MSFLECKGTNIALVLAGNTLVLRLLAFKICLLHYQQRNLALNISLLECKGINIVLVLPTDVAGFPQSSGRAHMCAAMLRTLSEIRKHDGY
jgi:hypothetical protein